MINVLDKETIYRIFYIYLFYTQESKVDTGLPAFLPSYIPTYIQCIYIYWKVLRTEFPLKRNY